MCLFGNHRWGKVEDSYQYCIKCGLARPTPHMHVWKEKVITKISNGREFIAHIYLYECSICGETRQEKIHMEI